QAMVKSALQFVYTGRVTAASAQQLGGAWSDSQDFSKTAAV
ncbi:hypothetical protein HaLaN_29461, partial [Haematococcus lacustris]